MARKGFTLVEVLLVVLILAVLASIVVPRIAESTAGAKQAQCDATRSNLIHAIELYATNNDGTYPTSIADVCSPTYFPHGAPDCPYGTTYVYEDGNDTIVSHSH